MTGRRLAACALAAVLAAGCVACTSAQSHPAAGLSPAASSPPAALTPAAGIPALAAILPFRPARLRNETALLAQASSRLSAGSRSIRAVVAIGTPPNKNSSGKLASPIPVESHQQNAVPVTRGRTAGTAV